MEEQSKKPTYKYCIVPKCKNTIRNAPDKVFFHVPRGADIRRKWCKIMKRDMVSPSTCLYCCEDHFDIEEDTDNYMEYKIMYLQEKRNCTLRLKKGIVPHKFQCRKDNKLQPGSGKKGSLKRKHIEAIEDIPNVPPIKQSVTVIPVQAEIKVCRGCLALDVKMFDMKDFELSEMFQNVTGISVHDNTELTHHRVCWECAARLTAASTFRDKALLSDALLKDIAHMKKSDLTTLKQNYSMLKSRLTVFTALSHFNIKYEETDKEMANDEVKYESTNKEIITDKIVSNEIKTEIDQNEIEFEEHEPWLDIHVKMEVESNSISENNIKNDAFKKITRTNDDSTSKEDFSSNKSDIASRLTSSTDLSSSDIENKDKQAVSSNDTVLKDTTIKQERKETEPWEDISVKIEIESDTTGANNTKSDEFIKVIHSNNVSTFKKDRRCGIRSSELENDVEGDAKMSYDTVISDNSNRKVNIVEVNDKEKKSKLNVISIIEEESSSEDDTQCLADLVSVEKAKRKDKL